MRTNRHTLPRRGKKLKTLESALEQVVIQALQFKGFLPLKTDAGIASRYLRKAVRSDLPPGFPDLVVLHPKQPAYFIEMKAEAAEPSADQLLAHQELRQKGYTVFVVEGDKGVEAFLQGL